MSSASTKEDLNEVPKNDIMPHRDETPSIDDSADKKGGDGKVNKPNAPKVKSKPKSGGAKGGKNSGKKKKS